jgi:hypothetical protein
MAPSALACGALILAFGAGARGSSSGSPPTDKALQASGDVAARSDTTAPRRPLHAAHRLSLSLAYAHASVLDPVASPLRYTGSGLALQTGLSRASGDDTRLIELALEAEAPRLGSALSSTNDGPREQMAFGALHLTAVRRLGAGVLPGALFLGAQARLEGTLRSHRYTEAAQDFYFGWAFAAVGPAAVWRFERANGGGLRLDAAAPLVGLVYRPYGDLAYARNGIHPALAAPPALVGLDAGARWTVPLGARVAGARAVLEWRLSYRQYRDHELYRAARDRLGVSLELPLGRAR